MVNEVHKKCVLKINRFNHLYLLYTGKFLVLQRSYFVIRRTVILQLIVKDGLLSPDSQITTTKIGCWTMVAGGMTNRLLWEIQIVLHTTLT